MFGAEGAVGCGQGGALALRTDHGGGSLQAERLQLLTGTGRKAVGDLGLWPDLEDKRRTTVLNSQDSKSTSKLYFSTLFK